jgi:hypothetical protein
MVVRVVDIGRIYDHHCIHFLFINLLVTIVSTDICIFYLNIIISYTLPDVSAQYWASRLTIKDLYLYLFTDWTELYRLIGSQPCPLELDL